MPAKATFLVRGGDGRMASVIAHSNRGALKIYMAKHRPPRGATVSVKLRGDGDWVDYKITG